MAAQPDKLFCPSCGEKVEYFVMLADGDELKHCSICGLILQGEKQESERTPRAAPVIKTLQHVVAAEDSPLLLMTVTKMLQEKKIAKTVDACKNGEEFIATVVERLKAKTPVSLAILDVSMPILNGINAAVILRAIERGYERNRPVPILFFTAYKCDDTFKKVLKYCAPAKYINKGVGSSPDEFAERLYQVVSQLLGEQ